MRELRISSETYNKPTDDDCFLDASDPLHSLMAQGMMGTLSSAAVDQAYAAKKRQDISDEHFKLRDEAKRQGIRPGTPAWFALTQGK
jgi:hypothetical protein